MSLKYPESRLIWDTYRDLLMKIGRKKRREEAKKLTQTELLTDVPMTPRGLRITIIKARKDDLFKWQQENSLRRARVTSAGRVHGSTESLYHSPDTKRTLRVDHTGITTF